MLNPARRKDTGQCYLPLDRVFTMPGFGTVATGTLRYGALTNGWEVEIMPRGNRARIRQLQVHNKVEEVAFPGQRVAVNLRNIGREQVARGDALASPGYLAPTRLLDVELQLLERADPVPRYGETIRVLFGTSEISAALRILGDRQPKPGSICVAQLACRHDVAVPTGERFIVRSMSPVRTVGGGRILDNCPAKHRRLDPRAVSRLSGLASGSTAEVIHELIRAKGSRGMEMDDLSRSVNLATDELIRLLDKTKVLFAGTNRLLSRTALDALRDQALAAIGRFHEANPNRKGQPLTDLRASLDAGVDDLVFRFLLEQLDEQDLVQTDKTLVRLRDFDPLDALSAGDKKIAGEIAAAFKAGGLQPPELNEVLQGNPHRQRLYRLLAETGELAPLHNRGDKPHAGVPPPQYRRNGAQTGTGLPRFRRIHGGGCT